MTTTTDWEELVTTSHLDTVTKIKWLLEEEDYEEAREGIVILEETMSAAQKRSLKSQLERLMLHIIKWQHQPQKRSTSWVRSIVNARIEIRKWQEEKPSFNNNFIYSLWNDCFFNACEEAKAEMGLSRKDKFELNPLTWEQVFEDEYLIEQND